MAWFVLIVSGMFEAVWAIALGKTEGFSKLVPSLVFAGGLIVSMSGLAYAMKDIPTGTAYAVWVGIGASLTVIYGMAVDGESISWIKVLLLMLLVGCVVGLKYVE
ncbi:DMT family transporter [Arthrobacter rhombi]|uniref:DMT family transporter n=1 Tax=Arthrobacter rhombi TaxID=71253 RepID=UPI003F8ED72F